MQIQERSYGGQLFRPRPEVFLSENKDFFLVVTPWGPAQIAKDFIEIVVSQMRDSENDPDKTVVFLNIDSLTLPENRLRMAIMTAHEDLRDKYNDEGVTAGLEIFCMIRTDKKLTWFQLGAPFTSILRGSKIIPVHHPLDLSFDYSRGKVLPPLPKDLLALQSHVQLEVGSFRVQHGDKLLLISRSYVPAELFKSSPQEMTIESVTKTLSEDEPDHPFWTGIIEL